MNHTFVPDFCGLFPQSNLQEGWGMLASPAARINVTLLRICQATSALLSTPLLAQVVLFFPCAIGFLSCVARMLVCAWPMTWQIVEMFKTHTSLACWCKRRPCSNSLRKDTSTKEPNRSHKVNDVRLLSVVLSETTEGGDGHTQYL